MFDRWKLLIGEDSLNIIKNKKIMIIGVGGVGGECVISLIRSGIENIVIIDHDVVELSNINRQVIAYHSTLGKKKVDVLSNIIKDINPNIKVSKYDLFLTEENIDEVMSNEKPDYIIDCCDTIKTKKAIIRKAIDYNISFISSMGTGNKLDPSKLEIADIKKTDICPLAKIIRKWAKEENIKEKIMVLYSKEIPIYKGEVVGSSSFVPNAAGLYIASYVIKDLLKM